MAAIEAAFFPILGKLPDKAYKRGYPRHRADQQMVLASTFGIQRAFSLSHFSHQQIVAGLQLEEARRQRPFRHKFEEEFNFVFKGSRDDRLGTLCPLAVVLDSECGVLTRSKLELAAGLDANHPQVRSELLALRDPCPVKFLVPYHHFLRILKPSALNTPIKTSFAGR